MSERPKIAFGLYFLIVAAIGLFGETTVNAASDNGLPQSVSAPVNQNPSWQHTRASLIFDPESKKYFIGGNAKFMLRQTQDSSIIDRIEVSVDGGEYFEYKDGIALQNEGKHTIKFRAINPVNNWSPVQFVELFLDLTAPSTETKFEEGKFWYTKDDSSGKAQEGKDIYAGLGSSVSFLAQDNLSGVAKIEYSWESETAFMPYSKPILIDKPGKRVLFYRSTDRVGNAEPIQKVTFIADGQAPNSELDISGGPLKPTTINGVGYLSTRDSISFAVKASDTESGVREMNVSVDGKAPVRYLKPIFFLQEGPHTLTYFSEDNVGNREQPKTLSVYSISTAPRSSATTVGKVINKGGINYARRDLKLKLSAGENAVGLDHIEYRIDPNPEFTMYVEPLKLDKMGENSVVYRSVDRAGNIEPSRNFRVVVTESAPETKVETSQPLVIRDGITYSPSPNTVTLKPEGNGVGVESTMMSINDGPFTAYKGPIAISAEQRIYKISFKSIDELGNEESPKTVTYHMIGTAPMVDLFVSDGVNLQEQVRTDYFDRPGTGTLYNGKRGVASQPQNDPNQPVGATSESAPAAGVVPSAAPAKRATPKGKKGPQ